jgi:hypothetical protein
MKPVLWLFLLFTSGCTIVPHSHWYHPEKSQAEEIRDENACRKYVELFTPPSSQEAKYIYKEKEMKSCMQKKGYVWQVKKRETTLKP